MQDSSDLVSVNDALADSSAAYLAMWSALESFNPKADRWSEPFDFGNGDERIKNAENAIARFHESVRKPGAQILKDIQTFSTYARELKNGAGYGEAIHDFASYLRQCGSRLADESVGVVRAKPTEPDGGA